MKEFILVMGFLGLILLGTILIKISNIRTYHNAKILSNNRYLIIQTKDNLNRMNSHPIHFQGHVVIDSLWEDF